MGLRRRCVGAGKPYAVVERLPAMAALGNEMQPHGPYMAIFVEFIGIFHLLAVNFQFEQAPIVQAHTVALPQVVAHSLGQPHKHGDDRAARGTCAAAHLAHNLAGLHGLLVNGYSLVSAVVLQRGAVFFRNFVFHVERWLVNDDGFFKDFLFASPRDKIRKAGPAEITHGGTLEFSRKSERKVKRYFRNGEKGAHISRVNER